MTAPSAQLIGSHVERADVLGGAAQRGAAAVQVNLSAPQTWRQPATKGDESQIAGSGMPVFVHAPYLVNPSSINPELRAKSRTCLQQQAAAAASIGASGLVIHGGHPTGEGTVNDAIDGWLDTLDGWTSPVPLLVENTAGGKSGPARHLENWGRLLHALRNDTPHPIGACLDTCHAFAGGMGTPQDLIALLEAELGGVNLVHLNDSKDPEGSGRDRHENLGVGTIAPDWLVAVSRDAVSRGIPVVVETPGGPEAQAADISWLRERL